MIITENGLVSEINHEKGTVKLYIEDEDRTTPDLLVFQGRTSSTKKYSMPEINENGIAIYDSKSYGVGWYLGGGYDDVDKPPLEAGKGIEIVVFSDGSKVKYDSNNGTLDLSIVNNININAKKINIYASENLNIQSPSIATTSDNWSHAGPLTVSGIIETLTNVICKGLSFLAHIHKYDGDKNTSPPK